MEEEIIFKIELNAPEAEANLRSFTTAIVSLKDENKLLTDSINNLKKAEGDNTKQIVEATAQIELNKNKIKELNQQQGQLIKTLDAEKGSINQLKAANVALLKERDNISKSTAEGKARIEALNKQYDENSKKINENISDTERQKQGYNTLIDILDKINPGTKELVTNVGTISKGFTQSIGAINQYGFSLKALGSIPVLQLFTALTSAVSGISQLYKSTLPTVEDYRKENEKLTKEYDKQQTALTLLEASTKRQVDLLRAEGKEKEANQVASKAAADRLIEEQLRANQLSDELENLNTKLAATPAIYDKLTGTQQINKSEQDVLKEAISQVAKEFTTQKEVVATVLNEYNILQEQSARLSNQEAQDAKEKAAQTKKELEDLEELRKKRQELIEQRRRETLEGARALKGTGGKNEDELILEAYNKLQDAKTKKDEERSEIVSGLTDKFLEEQEKIDEKLKKADDEEIKRKKASAGSELKIERAKNEAIQGFIDATTQEKSLARVALTSVFKKDALLEAYTSTKAAAIAAYKSLAGIPIVGPALGALAAGAATAFGLSQVAAISGVNFPGFALSGRALSGTRINNTHGIPINRSNGDNLLATVKTGEVILNERHQAMLGGNKTFARIGVPGFADSGRVNFTNEVARQSESAAFQASLFNSISQIQTVLVLQDFEAKSKQVNSVKQRSVVIK